jgi:hypothetical protein
MALGWHRRCKLPHGFMWGQSYKRQQLAQLLGQLGVSRTRSSRVACRISPRLSGLVRCVLVSVRRAMPLATSTCHTSRGTVLNHGGPRVQG